MSSRKGLLQAVVPGTLFTALGAVWALRTRAQLADPADPALWGMRDFRDGVYYPVRAWLEGVNPYSPTQFLEAFPQVDQMFPLVSPGVLLLNLPFSTLPYDAAMVAFFVVSLLLLVVYAGVILRAADVRLTPARVLWLAAFLVAGRPAYAALTLGQGILPIAIGVTLALRYARSNPAIGGLGLSLALLKPTFGAPLLVLLLVRRDYRSVAIGVAVAAATALIPLATIVANSGVEGFVAGISETLSTWGAHPAVALSGDDVGRFDAAVALYRLVGLRVAEVNSLPVALAVLVPAAIALLSLQRRAHPDLPPGERPETEPLSSLVILLAVLLCVYHQRYDALVLAGPIVALAARGIPQLPAVTAGWLLALLVAVWFNFLTTTSAVYRLGLTPWEPEWRLVASLNSLALLVAFGVVVVRSIRTGR